MRFGRLPLRFRVFTDLYFELRRTVFEDVLEADFTAGFFFVLETDVTLAFALGAAFTLVTRFADVLRVRVERDAAAERSAANAKAARNANTTKEGTFRVIRALFSLYTRILPGRIT
jgi:hypothetical protein